MSEEKDRTIIEIKIGKKILLGYYKKHVTVYKTVLVVNRNE